MRAICAGLFLALFSVGATALAVKEVRKLVVETTIGNPEKNAVIDAALGQGVCDKLNGAVGLPANKCKRRLVDEICIRPSEDGNSVTTFLSVKVEVTEDEGT